MTPGDQLPPVEARKRYAEDYDKTVKPLLGLAMDYTKMSAEYGKVTLQYLFLFNGGGLTGLVALYPTVQHTSPAWVTVSIWSAVFFGFGLFCVSAAAGISFVTSQQAAANCYRYAAGEEAWAEYYSKSMEHEATGIAFERPRPFEPGRNRATNWAVGCAILSAASAIAGGIWLALSLARLIPASS